MQNPLRKTELTDPAALADDLVAARQDYIERRNSVIDRAVSRRNMVNELIAEHEQERDELEKLVKAASGPDYAV